MVQAISRRISPYVADNRQPNSVAIRVSPSAPNQMWVTDITYIPTQEGWLYLAGVKDVFTCELVGDALGERLTQELVS